MFILLEANPLTIYNAISIVGYVLAALCLVGAIAVFFLMDIPSVYEYLTGKKQQKGIMAMRQQQGEQNGLPPLAEPTGTGKIGGFMEAPKKVVRKKSNNTESFGQQAPAQPAQPAQPVSETQPIQQYQGGDESGTSVLEPANNSADYEATGVLGADGNIVQSAADPDATGVLSADGTMLQSSDPDATGVLTTGDMPVQSAPAVNDGGTTVLSDTNYNIGKFILVKNEMLIHTEEVL